MPFEERSIERASIFHTNQCRFRTCSAEDLLVHKTFAGRPQDWVDVETVLSRTSPLDWSQIEEELLPLLDLKGTPESWNRLLALKR